MTRPSFLTGILVAPALAAPAWAGPIVSFTNGSEAHWLLQADCSTQDMVLVHSSPSVYTPTFRPPELPVMEFDSRGSLIWNPFGPSSQVRIGAILGERRKRNCISLEPGEGVGIFTIPRAGREGKGDTYFFELTDRNERLGPAFAVTRDGSGRWSSNWEQLCATDRSMMHSALRWDGWSALIHADVWTLEWHPFKEPVRAEEEQKPSAPQPAEAAAGKPAKASRPFFRKRSLWEWFQCICGCEMPEIDEDE